MPLRTDIDDLVLDEAADDEGVYMYLLDPADERFVAGACCVPAHGYLECVDLVSDGYGPTLFLLLMQKARREGLKGVAPDLLKNSEEAKRMDARFYGNALPAVLHVPNPNAHHPEIYLNQIYFLTSNLIAEKRARRNADRHFGRTPLSRWRLQQLRKRNPVTHDLWHTPSGILPLLKNYLLRSKPQNVSNAPTSLPKRHA